MVLWRLKKLILSLIRKEKASEASSKIGFDFVSFSNSNNVLRVFELDRFHLANIPLGERFDSTVIFEGKKISQDRLRSSSLLKSIISLFKIKPSAIPVPPPIYMVFLECLIRPITELISPNKQHSES